jgi:hypothetical protein
MRVRRFGFTLLTSQLDFVVNLLMRWVLVQHRGLVV